MDSSSDALAPVALLADEFMERQRAGEQPTIDEYIERHPELADEIRDVFPALAVIEQIAPASADLEQSQTSHESPAHVRVSQIGDYRILREIGRGGMGVVYEAEQKSLRRRVALKVLPRQVAGDQKALQRFHQEARAAARMHHTNIVPVFEVNNDDEHVFYAMQLIQGQGLDAVIEDLQRLRSEHSGLLAPKTGAAVAHADRSHEPSIAESLVAGQFAKQDFVAEAQQPGNAPSEEYNATIIAETAAFDSNSTASAVLPGQSEISSAETNRVRYYHSVAQIGHQSAGALAYAHARGIIHRDIKPSNLLLDTAGIVWITDFGLAKTGDETLTHTGDILGTIRYMSPERFQGRCDVRADVYSLGLTLYELLLLKPAYSSPDRLKLIEMVAKTEPLTPRSIDPRIPRDLETIVLKSIDKDPRRRYPTADDLADDLERFIHDEPIQARRISNLERLARWSRRNKALAASLGAATVMLVVIAVGSVLAAGYYRQMEQKASADAFAFAELANEKEQLAEDRETEARNARDQEQAAIAAKDEAIEARQTAVQAQQTLQRELYVSDMLQARLAYQEGAIDRLVELLNRHIPLEGDTDLRGWEWYYWWRASRLHQHQFWDGGPLRDMAVAPDGSWVAVRAWERDVVIFDAQSMVRVATLHGCHWGDFETELAVSPDGRLLAALGYDGDVKLWRTDDWSELPSLQPEREEGRRLKGIAFSATGLLAAGDSQGRVTFWIAEQQTMEGPPLETGQLLGCLVFSPDGSQLVTGDGVARNPNARGLLVWNVADRVETPLLEGQSGVTALLWTMHDDRSVIAAGNVDGSVRLWDAATAVEFARVAAGGPVESMSFSSDGSRLAASTSRNNAVQIWETGSGRRIATMRGHSRKVSGVCFVGDDQTVWSSSEDSTLNVWDVRQSQPFLSLQSPVDPDRRRTVTFGADNLSLWRQDAPDDHELNREIHRWNATSGATLPAFAVAESPVVTAFSNNGRFLAVVIQDASAGFSLAVWRTDLAQPLQGQELVLADDVKHYRPMRLAVSDDGSTVAWTSELRLVAINVATGDYRIGNTGVTGGQPALSPDGRLLCVPTFWTTQLWDISGDSAVRRADISGDGPANNARISRDGNYLAVAHWNNEVRVHDSNTGERLYQFRGHAGSVWALAFSPDGRLLASGGIDGTVRLWDLDPEHPGLLLTLSAHDTDVTSVAFSPDGRTIASTSTDGDTRLWTRASDSEVQQDVDYWTYRAEAHELRQAWSEAAEDWTAANRVAPSATHYERRAILYLKLERLSEAMADVEQAIVLGGANYRHRLAQLATWFPLPELPAGATLTWRYSLREPAGDWRDRDFDDSEWPTGVGCFETTVKGSGWPSNQIWLRAEVELGVAPVESLQFFIHADDVATIHVNGQQAARAVWSAQPLEESYQVVPSSVPLVAGRNVIAVHCANSGGHGGAVHVMLGHRNSGESLIALLSPALDAEPENADLLRERADLYALLGRWDEAAADQVKALQIRSRESNWTDDPEWNSSRSKHLMSLCGNLSLFHALSEVWPDAADLSLARGRSLALRGDWSAAADAFSQYPGDLPSNSEIWFEMACARLVSGDEKGYRELMHRYYEQADGSFDPFANFILARTAGMAPQDSDLAQKAVGWGEYSLTDIPRPWNVHALGLAHYRTGDYDAAIRFLRQSLNEEWNSALNQVALALVYHDAGDEQRARQLLNDVRNWMDEQERQAIDGAVDVQVIDWLAFHALHREAEAKMDAE